MKIFGKKYNNYKSKKFWLGIVFVFFGLLLMFLESWIYEEFGFVSIESVIFQMKAPMIGTNSDYYISFLQFVFLPSIIIAGAMIFFIKRIKNNYMLIIGTIVMLGGIIYFGNEMRVVPYIIHQFSTTQLYEEYYVDPNEVDIEFPKEKRNLIYIYMESMENTYKSPENLIPMITKMQDENISFKSKDGREAKVLSNCDWTIASMVAQTAGVPLSIPISDNSYDRFEEFLPGITNLGDILENNGYNQEILLGSDSEFAGTDHMFIQHGNYSIMDYERMKKDKYIHGKYFKWWGVEDKKLYQIAKDRILKLADQDEPFNFTMATMDTHAKDGYTCYACEDKHSEKYANVIACADSQIYEFVEWIKEQSFYDNTTIIIVGDHLSMNSEFFENKYSKNERTTLNLIVNPAQDNMEIKNREFCTMDMFPTTLAAIGVDVEGQRLGLGTNLFSDKKTLLEELGEEYLSEEILKKSKYYEKFLY